MKVIIITGTPCTGKTTLAKKLCKNYNYEYINVNKIIRQSRLKEEFDKKRRCLVIDENKLAKALIKKIKELKKLHQKNLSKKDFFGIIIDSHLSHYLPKRYVDLCIVTKCNLKILEKRYNKRGYAKSKIRENLDCEIFDVCYNEAVEMGHKVVIVDTTQILSQNLAC